MKSLFAPLLELTKSQCRYARHEAAQMSSWRESCAGLVRTRLVSRSHSLMCPHLSTRPLSRPFAPFSLPLISQARTILYADLSSKQTSGPLTHCAAHTDAVHTNTCALFEMAERARLNDVSDGAPRIKDKKL